MNKWVDKSLLERFTTNKPVFEKDHIEVKSESLVSKMLFVIVLYEMKITDSPAFKSLNSILNVYFKKQTTDLLVCDNSLERQINKTDISNNNWTNIYYIHDRSNPGISLSYNRAVKLAYSRYKKWMLVLDQDTIMPVTGLFEYESALMKWPNFPIYAPKLYSENLLLSPCNYFMYRGTNLPSINFGVHRMRGKNVLNSGLLIAVDAFLEVGGYDEQVSLYFSDFIFFNRLKRNYDSFVIIECSLTHTLSSSDYSSLNFSLNRFTQYCLGARAAASSDNNKISYFMHFITVGLRSVKMSFRFNNFKFIKTFINFFLLKKNEN